MFKAYGSHIHSGLCVASDRADIGDLTDMEVPMNSLLKRIARDISETLAGAKLTDEERYVARSSDTADVERRMRELERGQSSRSI